MEAKLIQPSLISAFEGLKADSAMLSSLLAFIPGKSEKGMYVTWYESAPANFVYEVMGTEEAGDVNEHSTSVFQRIEIWKEVSAGAAMEIWIPVAFTLFAL